MPSPASVSAPLSTDVVIVGAGVLGLCTAVTLKRRGHRVAVIDPGGRNASAVAAGMIAPALEAALDDVTPERAALFRSARRVWDDFGVDLEPGPAAWRGPGGEAVAARLKALGFAVRVEGADVLTPEDVRIEPETVLAAWREDLQEGWIQDTARQMERVGEGWRVTGADGGVIEAPFVVLASGTATAPGGSPRAVAGLIQQLQPIRGQIGWTAERLSDRVMRGEGAYVAPSQGGTLIGASMEAGRRDLEPEAETGQRLLAAAGRLVGRDLSGTAMDWRVGIRGSTIDGLPLAGATGEAGLFLALAPRRNGWLLGPLIGQVVADGIEGRATSVEAAAFDPRRFF
ncbi:NAD(P)/FAD-dependent oxidoreductase [Brevundimonas sp.]|uniref:NAD(P)/FAD-dependent oxidoreductase n=1 Tax=Brevundimonas sp. TaxID=1871086 RepID=UPI003BA9E8CB